MNKKINLFFFFALICLASCRKDQPPTLPQGIISASATQRLLICDEGNFGQNNASVSIYDPSSNQVSINAFSVANPSYTLGDVAQSIAVYNQKYYVVVNNSGKIVVCNNNLQKQAAVTGFISPRYIEFVSNNKAYVSNLQLNSAQPNYIQVLDINTNTIIKNIRIDGWSEMMISSYGKTYVANQTKKYVYVIDDASDLVSDSIYMNTTNANMVKDENEKIWVSCNPTSTSSNTGAMLKKINPITNTVEDSILLPNPVSRLCINQSGTTLYLLANDVYKIDISSKTITDLIPQGGHTFYGLCVNPNDETLYVSDALNYNSNGLLYHYNQATLLGTYTVGINPGFMLVD
ncbi:MAG: hypothetical protein JST67_09240 [Bacteroidetes bacterium]|nr:hypothetical protein [Bacteroidota bacterium]